MADHLIAESRLVLAIISLPAYNLFRGYDDFAITTEKAIHQLGIRDE